MRRYGSKNISNYTIYKYPLLYKSILLFSLPFYIFTILKLVGSNSLTLNIYILSGLALCSITFFAIIFTALSKIILSTDYINQHSFIKSKKILYADITKIIHNKKLKHLFIISKNNFIRIEESISDFNLLLKILIKKTESSNETKNIFIDDLEKIKDYLSATNNHPVKLGTNFENFLTALLILIPILFLFIFVISKL